MLWFVMGACGSEVCKACALLLFITTLTQSSSKHALIINRSDLHNWCYRAETSGGVGDA